MQEKLSHFWAWFVHNKHRHPVTVLAIFLPVVALLTTFKFTPATANIEKTLPLPPVQLNLTQEEATKKPQDTLRWTQATVQSGDTLAKILSRQGLSPQTVHKLAYKTDLGKHLLKLNIGQTLHFGWKDREFVKLVFPVNDHKEAHFTKSPEEQFVSIWHEKPIETRLAYTQFNINQSLYRDGNKAGLDDALIYKITQLFGWDIDFALDIRSGDSVSLLFEELYVDGQKTGHGNIIAAEFINHGNSIKTVSYTNAKGEQGYFSPDGKNMKKAFIRTPVPVARISSHFNPNRKHPIWKTKRPHRGTDYAAPTGTPVLATGNGKVIFKGWKNGYGRTLVIKHGSTYSTLYAHLNGFKKGLRVGSKVKQGQTVAYVGKTGWATGPHLHYEFRINGVHKNPVTVKLPTAKSIAKNEMDAFKTATNPLLNHLAIYQQAPVAFNVE